MSFRWKWVWAYLFVVALLPAFGLVVVGELWKGVATLVLAMIAFARFVYIHNREEPRE